MHGKFDDLGRLADPSLLILTSLSGEPRHGYAIMTDVAGFSGVRMEPGTLYGALSRLERRGWVHGREEVWVIFAGVDWAETHHDVCVMGEDGLVFESGRYVVRRAHVAGSEVTPTRPARSPGVAAIGSC